jgi:hypothetical protein
VGRGDIGIQQREIARLCLEGEIEDVPEYRHHADQRIERDVAEHVHLDGRRRVEASRHAQREHGDQRAGDVTQARHQAEQCVEAEAPLRAGEDKGLVEQRRDRAQVFQ